MLLGLTDLSDGVAGFGSAMGSVFMRLLETELFFYLKRWRGLFPGLVGSRCAAGERANYLYLREIEDMSAEAIMNARRGDQAEKPSDSKKPQRRPRRPKAKPAAANEMRLRDYLTTTMALDKLNRERKMYHSLNTPLNP